MKAVDQPRYAAPMTPLDAHDLEEAWEIVHDALPTGWTIGPPSHHVEARERPWHVLAVDVRQRAKRREIVEATGWDEAEALRDLAGLLKVWNVETVEPSAD